MLYDTNAEKRNKTVCGQEETHNINQEQVEECQGLQLETFTTHQNKQIRVVLEFPNQTDSKAEAEFINRLKEIYLRKIEIGAMQEKEAALQSTPINNSVGSVSNDKEDKDYE